MVASKSVSCVIAEIAGEARNHRWPTLIGETPIASESACQHLRCGVARRHETARRGALRPWPFSKCAPVMPRENAQKHGVSRPCGGGGARRQARVVKSWLARSKVRRRLRRRAGRHGRACQTSQPIRPGAMRNVTRGRPKNHVEP